MPRSHFADSRLIHKLETMWSADYADYAETFGGTTKKSKLFVAQSAFSNLRNLRNLRMLPIVPISQLFVS